jgi:hypothetical protein
MKEIEKSTNKMISKEQVKTKDYFFPDYQITVSAESIEEAEQKLQALLDNNK